MSAFIDQWCGTFRERLGQSTQYCGELREQDIPKGATPGEQVQLVTLTPTLALALAP